MVSLMYWYLQGGGITPIYASSDGINFSFANPKLRIQGCYILQSQWASDLESYVQDCSLHRYGAMVWRYGGQVKAAFTSRGFTDAFGNYSSSTLLLAGRVKIQAAVSSHPFYWSIGGHSILSIDSTGNWYCPSLQNYNTVAQFFGWCDF